MRIDPKVIELIKNRYYKNAEWSFDEYRKCFVHTEDELKKAILLVLKYQKEDIEWYCMKLIPDLKNGDACVVHIATKLLTDLPYKKHKHTKANIKKEVMEAFPDFDRICLLDRLFHSIMRIETLAEELKDEKVFVENILETINIEDYDTI